MDPVALWEELLRLASYVIREVEAAPEDAPLLLGDDAYEMAMKIEDLNEWIQKGGFSPFDKSESYSGDSFTDEDSPNAQYERTNKNEDYV